MNVMIVIQMNIQYYQYKPLINYDETIPENNEYDDSDSDS